MAKTIYPVIKQYIQAHKSMDKIFVNQNIQLFEEQHYYWPYASQFIIRGRLLLTNNSADISIVHRLSTSKG